MQNAGENDRYGHAIVQIGGQYFDPTLQPLNCNGVQYWLGKTYTLRQLIQAMLDAPDVAKTAGGFIATPPAMRRDGTIVLTELPTELPRG